ncbi:hypothetical protein Taro_004848 [Colocasia esculenta]|uniref:Uncharacterized protein n=1 Tax=Colocasia esculenta TaxID=4460 RepID=A0A843TRA9_COLES|nr:hypothetical protein [Colocasia esculenta]
MECWTLHALIRRFGASSGDLQQLEASLDIGGGFPDHGLEATTPQNPEESSFGGFLGLPKESFNDTFDPFGDLLRGKQPIHFVHVDTPPSLRTTPPTPPPANTPHPEPLPPCAPPPPPTPVAVGKQIVSNASSIGREAGGGGDAGKSEGKVAEWGRSARGGDACCAVGDEGESVESGRTMVVGVRMDGQSRELLTWALVKVSEPGVCDDALHTRPTMAPRLCLALFFFSVSCFLKGFRNSDSKSSVAEAKGVGMVADASDDPSARDLLCHAAAGAAFGAIAATFVCPMDVIKTRLQERADVWWASMLRMRYEDGAIEVTWAELTRLFRAKFILEHI